MTYEFLDLPLDVAQTAVPVKPGIPLPRALSSKQRRVLLHLQDQAELSIAEAVFLIGGDIYANQRFHVGNVLRNMHKRGLIRRVRAGVYGRVNQ